jgi:hypothetical protein
MRTDSITVTESPYPAFTLWRRDIEDDERLKIINEEDFPRKGMFTSLGIADSPLLDSFGICNEEEIRARQDLCRYLLATPKLGEWLKHQRLDTLCALPTGETDFLDFFEQKRPRTPYWQAVRELIRILEKNGALPDRLQLLLNTLKSSLELEKVEHEFGRLISEKLEGITEFEGNVDILLWRCGESVRVNEGRVGNCNVYGATQFSTKLGELHMKPYPAWTDNRWDPRNWVGLNRLAVHLVERENERRLQAALRAMIICEPPESMIIDVRAAVAARLAEFTDWPVSLSGVARCYFHYKKGLRVQIYSVTIGNDFSADPPDTVDTSGSISHRGLSEVQLLTVADRIKQVKREIVNYRNLEQAGIMQGVVKQQDPSFFSSMRPAASPNLDIEFKWYALDNLYQLHAEMHRQLLEHRRWLKAHLDTLDEVVAILDAIKSKARKLKTKWCMPTIVGDEHVVGFREIYPLHLLGELKPEQVRPIESFPDLNGRMICLTGKHGEGKTTTAMALGTNLYLAQSGLIVLGAEFRFNIKRRMGLVFLTGRGKGSTTQILMAKTVKMLEGIKGMDGHEVVVFLDELGQGTQEGSGLKLGQDVLTKLAKSGVSVMVSTQILPMAQWAQRELGADCYQMDTGHKIRTGIGDGGMDELRETSGLNQLLK